MRLTFIRTDHEVAGSCHFLEVGNTKVLTGCGMEQGSNICQNTELPVGYHEVDYVLLTHVHIDRAGVLLQIRARRFGSQVVTTYATADLYSIVFKDSAHTQEVKAEWKSRKTRRVGRGEAEALHTMQDAEDVLRHFEGVAYGQVFRLNDNLTLRFTDVGHPLDSTSIEIWVIEGTSKKKIVLSGDTGDKDKPLIRNPQYATEAGYVVMKSTYGGRYHKKGVNHVSSLARTVQETLDRQGNVIIPAFAMRRTQESLYLIRHIKEERFMADRDSFEVYVDSPLAVGTTHVFKDSILECYDGEAKALVERGINPTDFLGLKLPITGEEFKNVNSDMMPKVIISVTGMCDAGRIHRHLKHDLWKSECSVVFTGYQAEGTLKQILQDGVQIVGIFGEEIDVQAHIETMDGISDYADRDGFISWISAFEKGPDYVFVVHGGEESCISFPDVLNTYLLCMSPSPRDIIL